jgi:hypothetical protein
MPAGRPTELNQEILDKTIEYIDSCEDTITGEGNNQRINVNLPSIEGLALYLDVSRKTIYNWRDTNDEFLHILEKLLGKQAKCLLNNGLAGRYNSTISKLILTKHGYTDKQEVEHSGKMELKNITVDIIEPKGEQTTEPDIKG